MKNRRDALSENRGREPEAMTAPPVDLLTFVLRAHHVPLVADWFDFMDTPPRALVVHVGEDPAIVRGLHELCESHGIRMINLGEVTVADTTEREDVLLAEQMGAVESGGIACVVRLDTLPYRSSGVLWQENALKRMTETGALFVTGATRPYRADRPAADVRLLMTQRISNCFLIIAPDVWRRLQDGVPESASRYGRFVVEGAAEDYLSAHDLWGLRLLNNHDLRIFHCQEWSARIFEVRKAFRSGINVDRFLKGVQDDYLGPNSSYYMEVPAPLLRRARIAVGAWRRRVTSQLIRR